MKYVYDGTFFGFLTVVYQAYHDGVSQMESIASFQGSRDLFGGEIEISTDFTRAEKVGDAFLRNCGREAFRRLYYAFLCDDGSENLLFEYIRKGFLLKKNIYAYRSNLWMWEVYTRAQKTGNEAEKWRGILRFSELSEGMLYGTMNPTHNVLPLITRHFIKRFPEEEWAIHDIRRNVAAYYHQGHMEIVKVENPVSSPAYSGREKDFQRLWRDYWHHMAIKERKNPVLQRSFLPKKYWGCLTEMK